MDRIVGNPILEKQCILVVDDDVMNLKVAEHILKAFCDVVCVKSGEEAIATLADKLPDLILLDLHMPQMNGFEVLERLQTDVEWKEIPVIFLTADEDRETEIKGFQAGAIDFITKPFLADIVKHRVQRILELKRLQKHLEEEVKKQTAKAEERRKKVEQMSLQTIQTLAYAIDAKDKYTNGHSTRVSEYAVMLASELNWEAERIENLRYAALLHDIGKIGVPDAILNKPSRLTDVEYDIIKSHSTIGGNILKNITTIVGAENVARHHHERYDGRGYPDQLAGEEIPIEARVVGIADTFDAMNSKRIYRKPLSRERIREEFVKGRGTQFDPELLDIFLRLFDEDRLDIQEEAVAFESGIDHNRAEASGIILQKFMETMATQKPVDDIDFLTGLPMRNVGEHDISEAMLEDVGCLAFMDVDNLKRINDTIGHKSGDRVLVLMGDVLKQYQDRAVACRIGGDEFLFFMKGVERQQAVEWVEEIVTEFMTKKNEDVTIKQASLSVGLCMTAPHDTFAEVSSKADKALYHVKQNGKSGYFFYQKEKFLEKANKDVDLKKLVKSLQNAGGYSGAMDVEFREFAKLFEYMGNLRSRYEHSFHLVMVTVENPEEQRMYIEDIEAAMEAMEIAIQQTIRNVDVYTRYSSTQYLLILLEAGDSNIKLVVDRIFSSFYKNCGKNQMRLSFATAQIDSEEN